MLHAGLLALTLVAVGPPVGPVPAEVVHTPFESVQLAAADAAAIALADPDSLPYTRYLACYNAPRQDREKVWQTVSFLVNSLSTQKTIVRPPFVAGSDNTIIRINLDLYGISPAAWDKLAENGSGPAASATADPYFHTFVVPVGLPPPAPAKVSRQKARYGGTKATIVVTLPAEATLTINGEATKQTGGRREFQTPDLDREYSYEFAATVAGNTVKADVLVAGGDWVGVEFAAAVQGKVATGKRLVSDPPWLQLDGGAAVHSLIQLCRTESPILRADWFITFASWAPVYYDLAGLGDSEADFDRAVFADRKLSEKARSQTKGAILFSSVALHNRTLLRDPTQALPIGSYKWASNDYGKSTNEDDVINNLLEKKSSVAAREIIASRSNGLQAYFVVNGQGKRLDVADPNVAIDNEVSLQDKQVWVFRNCCTCHAAGIRPVADVPRQLARDKIALLVAKGSPEAKENAKRIQDLYFAHDLGPIILHDQTVFATAVKACNGLEAKANGAQFERMIKTYIDLPLTLETVAAEAGIAPGKLQAILEKAVNVDHTLTGLLAKPPIPIRRDQAEKVFGQTQLLIGTIKP